MRDGFVKIAAGTPNIRVADCMYNAQQIVALMIKELTNRCEKQMGIHLTVRDSVKKYIVDKAYNPKYGARPLRRAIQTKIEDEMATEILEGRIKAGDTVQVKVKDKKICFEVKDAEKA